MKKIPNIQGSFTLNLQLPNSNEVYYSDIKMVYLLNNFVVSIAWLSLQDHQVPSLAATGQLFPFHVFPHPIMGYLIKSLHTSLMVDSGQRISLFILSLFSSPRQSKGLLYKHRCDSFINWVSHHLWTPDVTEPPSETIENSSSSYQINYVALV